MHEGLIGPTYKLMVSNVAGPVKPMYLNGAELEGFVPMSIVTRGNLLNLAGIS